MIVIIKLLNNSIYVLQSYNGVTVAATDDDTDDVDDTLTTSNDVRYFSLHRLLCVFPCWSLENHMKYNVPSDLFSRIVRHYNTV
jgi:hypothetical protein